MELKQLSVFAAVYEERSMSRAAEKLNITQSHVSMLVKRLELELETVLFERHSGGTTATVKADVVYSKVRELLGKAADLRASVAPTSQSLRGSLRVGIAPTVARGVIFRELPGFLDDYPGIDLKLTEGMSVDLVEWTIAGEFDFAIVTNPPDDRRLVARRIALEPMVLISGLRSGRMPYALADLTISDPLRIVLPFGRHRPVGALNHFLSSGMIPVRQTVQTNSLTATLALIYRTDWVSILSVSAVSDRFDQFVVQRIEKPAHDTEFFLIRPARSCLSPAAEEFAGTIKSAFAHSLRAWNERL